MKKAISIFLILIMAIGICVPAYADGYSEEYIIWNDYYGDDRYFSFGGEIAPGETKTISSLEIGNPMVIKTTADKEGFYIFNLTKPAAYESEDWDVFLAEASDVCKGEKIYGLRNCCEWYGNGSSVSSEEIDKTPLFYLKAGETLYIEPQSYDDDIIADITLIYLGTFEEINLNENTMIFAETLNSGDCYSAPFSVKFSEGKTFNAYFNLEYENAEPGKHTFTYSFCDENVEREIEIDVHSISEFIKKVELPADFEPVVYINYRDYASDCNFPEYITITDANGNKSNYYFDDFCYELNDKCSLEWYSVDYNLDYDEESGEFSGTATLTIFIENIPYEFEAKCEELSFSENLSLCLNSIKWDIIEIFYDLKGSYSLKSKALFIRSDIRSCFVEIVRFFKYIFR